MSIYKSEIRHSNYIHTSLRNIVEAHLEVSSDCNLRCIYCFAAGEYRDRKLMPLDVAFKFVETILYSTSSKEIRFVIHGGEPLLQSANWIRNVLAYAYRLGRLLEKTVSFEMQSNLTLLNEDTLKVIKDYKVGVGTSLDGNPLINELSRENADAVISGINLLKSINCFGGLICVVGQNNCNNIYEVLSYFESIGIVSCSLLLRYSVGRGSSLKQLSADEILSAYMGSFDYLSTTKGNAVVDRNVAGKLMRFLRPPTKEDFQDILICDHPICGAGLTTCLCDTDGNLYPCGCSVCNPNNASGNIDDLFDDTYISKISDFHYQHSLTQEKCVGCEVLSICRCGCAAFSSMDRPTAESECEAIKMFYKILKQQPRDHIELILSNIEINRQW